MKKYLLPVIQILITVGLLCWIFRDPEQNRKMLEAIGKAKADGGLWWFLPGIAALGVAILLQTWRWMILLRVQEITVSFSRALRIILSGLFFNLFLLGSTGGDVIKIFFIMRETPDKKAGALLSVFIDRVVGVLALAVVSAVVILARWGELWNSARMGVLTVALILGGSLGFIFAAWLVDRLNLTSKLPHWLPMHDKMVEAAAAFSQYAKAGGAVGKAFLLSLPAHLLIFSTFYFAAKAFGAGLSLIGVFCVMPIVSTVTALPISLGGAGVREGLFITLLGALYATPKEIAMSISISGFLMVVFWSLTGGVVYLLYRSSSHGGPKIFEMEKSVEEEEHIIIETPQPPRD
ncbi:MAG: lysylphosphatidylglycerol synthase transmembrane domain-containing protein [Verrucomicrobiota bacterium]